MPILNIEDAKPGMTLAEAVRNHQGQLLLENGRRITEKSIRIFKSWGIRKLAIKSGPASGEPSENSLATRRAAAIDEGIKDRFADVETDPLMAAIMQAAARQLALRQPKKKTGYGLI